MAFDLLGSFKKKAENNKDTAVEKLGTGCDKNYFHVRNEQMYRLLIVRRV